MFLSSCIRNFHRNSKDIIQESKIIEKSIKEIYDKTAPFYSSGFYGDIIDIETNEKLPYVNNELKRPIKTYGTSTNSLGNFQFKNIIAFYYKADFVILVTRN